MRRIVLGLMFVTFVLSTWGGMHYFVWTHVTRDVGLQAGASRDLALALSAYNAGMTRVDRTFTVPEIPETKGYVTEILGRLGK